MFPVFSTNNPPDTRTSNSIFSRYFSSLPPRIIFPYPQYILFFKFRKMTFFATSKTMFFRRIFVVISSCSKEKMVWPYARWIVALMKNTEPIFNFTIMKRPRYAMCPYKFPIPIDLSISFAIMRTIKNPTSIRFFNLFPKSFLNWNTWSNHRVNYGILGK